MNILKNKEEATSIEGPIASLDIKYSLSKEPCSLNREALTRESPSASKPKDNNPIILQKDRK